MARASTGPKGSDTSCVGGVRGPDLEGEPPTSYTQETLNGEDGTPTSDGQGGFRSSHVQGRGTRIKVGPLPENVESVRPSALTTDVPSPRCRVGPWVDPLPTAMEGSNTMLGS